MNDTNRAEFETWVMISNGDSNLIERDGDNYDIGMVDSMWEAWQAARTQPAKDSIDSQLDSNTLKKMVFLSESKKSMRPVGVVLIDDDTNQRCTIDMGRVMWTGQPTAEDSSEVHSERVALSDAEIERIFYPSGRATANQLLIARGIGRAILAAQADAPITQPLIAEAARDDVAVEIDELLTACRRAILPLAHAAEGNKIYQEAYEKLDGILDAAWDRRKIEDIKRDDVAGDASHIRLLNAARTYADNYLQDERDEPELCIHAGQHAEIVELFAAIVASMKVAQ